MEQRHGDGGPGHDLSGGAIVLALLFKTPAKKTRARVPVTTTLAPLFEYLTLTPKRQEEKLCGSVSGWCGCGQSVNGGWSLESTVHCPHLVFIF